MTLKHHELISGLDLSIHSSSSLLCFPNSSNIFNITSIQPCPIHWNESYQHKYHIQEACTPQRSAGDCLNQILFLVVSIYYMTNH